METTESFHRTVSFLFKIHIWHMQNVKWEC